MRSCNSRAVYNRYEAVGDPVSGEGLDPNIRFVWVLERGEWVEKSKVLEEKKSAGLSKGKKSARRPRATRAAKRLGVEEEVKRGEGTSDPAHGESVDRSGKTEDAGHRIETRGEDTM